ncbi:MAG: universal stress protein [Magnetovibrio sp.]|nr:universal stress protein [Magnetovibrio sp.]
MYKKILIPIDYADEASWKNALPAAIDEAERHGAELHAITVVPEILRLPNLPENYGSGACDHVKKTVEGIVADNGGTATVVAREGSIYREILKEAHAIGADLIVIASPKAEFMNELMGPNVARVVRNAHCSILVVRD